MTLTTSSTNRNIHKRYLLIVKAKLTNIRQVISKYCKIYNLYITVLVNTAFMALKLLPFIILNGKQKEKAPF